MNKMQIATPVDSEDYGEDLFGGGVWDEMERLMACSFAANPSLREEFARPLDTGPPHDELVQRAASGEFAKQSIADYYGENILQELEAHCGA
ncbi:MAG: hypothetical protein ACO1SX_20610 [Actinomycetota bacterium]